MRIQVTSHYTRESGMGDWPSIAYVWLDALVENLAQVRALAPGLEVIGVIKADAYGHGAVPVARALEGAGCEKLAVVTVTEASEVRAAGVSLPMMVLGGIVGETDARRVADLHLCPVVHGSQDLVLAREAARCAKRPQPLQLEVDTGMSRLGVSGTMAVELASEIERDPNLVLEGTFTHFAHADDSSPKASLKQIAAFRTILGEMKERGVDPGIVHAANSSAVLAGSKLLQALPEAKAVRPGLMLYGARSAPHEDPDRRLRSVMSVRARVVAVREIPPGQGVGYGAAWRSERSTRIATLSLGYADGVLRSLSNRGAFWLGGVTCPIVGRVSMDSVMVDVGNAPTKVGDQATFFGRASQTEEGISVEAQAEAAGTLPYELLTSVGARVHRQVMPIGSGWPLD